MRPSLDTAMLLVARALGLRATCGKLKVGCVLTDKYGRIIGSGYNGVARGEPHCSEQPCPGFSAPKGSDLCEAVHAEQNALMQCRDTQAIYTAYVTHAPCMRCTKELLNTSCERIIFTNGYDLEPQAKDLWLRAGRIWHQHFLE